MKSLWARKILGTISHHIVAGLVGVIMGILGVYLVYPLHSRLSRDRITIEEVEIIPEKTQFEFPREEFSNLRSWLFDEYDKTVGLRFLSLRPPRAESILNEYEFKFMQSMVEGYQDYLNQIQVKIDDLPTNNLGQITIKLESLFRFPPYRSSSSRDPLERMEMIKMDIEKAKKTSGILLSKLTAFTPERTGNIRIKVMVLNSGDTDGLVQQTGSIVVNDKHTLTVKVESSQMDEAFPSIPKRSMVVISLVIDEGKSNTYPVKAVKNIVLREVSLNVLVKLKDIRGNEIDPMSGSLPPSPLPLVN